MRRMRVWRYRRHRSGNRDGFECGNNGRRNLVAVLVNSTFGCIAFQLLICCTVVNAQENTPRFEIGGIVSDGKQTSTAAQGGNENFHLGGGGRFTVNATQYLAGEVEFTVQPTGAFGYPREYHTALALKGTYRAEQKRWLGFAGVNFFGVIGPAFVRRTVEVDNPLPSCITCALQERVTTAMVDFGGGVEIVPARPIAIRFDITHASFDEIRLFRENFPNSASRTYIKVAVMLRFP